MSKAPANLAEPASEEELNILREALIEFALVHYQEAIATLTPEDRDNNTHLEWFESVLESLVEEKEN